MADNFALTAWQSAEFADKRIIAFFKTGAKAIQGAFTIQFVANYEPHTLLYYNNRREICTDEQISR